mmetsp:Transcript_26355/g.82050  ORF Transcript_26355/g.82050 Transcript_26355/m.82050 type:complete len:340 (+) Transcript_26355:1435-2454(+)
MAIVLRGRALSGGLVTAAACSRRTSTKCDAAPIRRVTPVRDLERDVIVLERQVAGAPLKRVSLEDMVDDLSDPSRRLLLFGENHEDARAQDVERSVYEGVARSQRSRRRVALALEFVDADAREAVDSFATGASDDVAALFRGATDAARYGPIACLARALGCPIVAANAPRRHARLVSRNGPAALDELPPDDVSRLPPLPYPDKPLSPAYAERLRLVGLKSANIIAAQCLWDAAMAHSCLDFLRGAPQDAIMLVCGSFHVQHFLGIVDHVERYTESDGPFEALERDEFRVVVCVPLDEATFLDHRRANRWDDKTLETFADFIVFTRGDATGEVAEGTCPA